MDSVALWVFPFLLLCLGICSGPGAAEESPPASTQLNKIHEGRKFSQSSSASDVQRDTIPIVNPTTPTTTTPIINPTSPTPPVTSTPTLATPTTPVNTPTAPSGRAWCIANPSASETALQVALDYACGYGGADCSAIQSGASCYDPNTVQDHASYAFNDYYQKNPTPTSCVFGGTAQLSYTDPSHGNCHFASSNTSSPATPTPVVPSPPSPVYTTPTPTEPGGSTVFGVAEPTGLPSLANYAMCNLLVLLIANGLILAAGYV